MRHADGSPADLRGLSATRLVLKLSGIWYEVSLTVLPKTARKVPHDLSHLSHAATRYAIRSKRQLGWRELLEAKLSNDA